MAPLITQRPSYGQVVLPNWTEIGVAGGQMPMSIERAAGRESGGTKPMNSFRRNDA
jgi:hypothetical protein